MKKVVFLVFLSVFLTATSSLSAQSSRETQTAQQSYSSKEHTGLSGEKSNQSSLSIIHEQPSNHNVDSVVTSKAKWWSSPDWWTALFTCGLFLATLLLWIFTALMWRSTSKSVQDGEKSIEVALRSAEAAEKSVSNSRELMTETRECSEHELRAYIGVLLDTDTTSIVQDSRFFTTIKICIKNFGHTPAFKLKVMCKMDVLKYPSILVCDGNLGQADQGVFTLNPGETITITYSCNPFSALVHATPAQISCTNSALYFGGRIDFIDVFKKKRWIKFSLYTFDQNTTKAHFFPCVAGNQSSEE